MLLRAHQLLAKRRNTRKNIQPIDTNIIIWFQHILPLPKTTNIRSIWILYSAKKGLYVKFGRSIREGIYI